MTPLILRSFCSSACLLVFCCVTNHPRTPWYKTTTVLSFVMILWVRNLGGARLGDCPVPCGADRGHLVVLSRLMGWSWLSRPASRLGRAGWTTVEGSLSSMVASGLSDDSHVSSLLQAQEEAAWSLTAWSWEVTQRYLHYTVLVRTATGHHTQGEGTRTPPLGGGSIKNRQLCFQLAARLSTVSGPNAFSGPMLL